MDFKKALFAVPACLALAAFAHDDSHATKRKPSLAAAAEQPFGRPAANAGGSRVITIDMTDEMRFFPARIGVAQGDVVRFQVRNSGKLLHELVLGRMEDLKEHAALMRKFPGMEHDEPYMAHIAPGKTGQLAWQFTKPGTFYYGCLIPGHLEAGMIGRIDVSIQ